ncbi:MAG: hypothetical protein AB1758_04210, partial [Candidatus Eremiobacterota bacterium]
MRRTLLAVLWLLLGQATWAERTEAVILDNSVPGTLVVRGSDGRKLSLRVSAATRWNSRSSPVLRERFRQGDAVRVDVSGSPPTVASVEDRSEPSRVAGRIRSLNPGRKELVLETASGPHSFSIPRGVAVFKENRPASWLDLHQGETVAVLQWSDGPPALALFDPISFLVREYEPQFGPLTALGTVVSVNETGPQQGSLQVRCADGQSRAVSFGPNTRWQLGARFSGPRDFAGVEALVFGSGPARMVVSRRAVGFW